MCTGAILCEPGRRHSVRPRASWNDTAGRKELVDVAAEFVDVKRKAEERCSRLEVLL